MKRGIWVPWRVQLENSVKSVQIRENADQKISENRNLLQHENSATWKNFQEKGGTWKKWNFKGLENEVSALQNSKTWKQRNKKEEELPLT